MTNRPTPKPKLASGLEQTLQEIVDYRQRQLDELYDKGHITQTSHELLLLDAKKALDKLKQVGQYDYNKAEKMVLQQLDIFIKTIGIFDSMVKICRIRKFTKPAAAN